MSFFNIWGKEKSNSGRIIRNTFYAQMVSITLSHITSLVGVLVDGIIIGRFLGLESMAAYGVVQPILLIFNLIGALISSGSRNMFTRLIGAGKVKEAQGVFSLSCILSVGISVIAMAITLPLSRPLCALLGASGNASNLLPKASDYLIGIAVGLPAMNAVRILSGYMSIDNDRNMPVYSMIVLTITDVIFDIVALSMNMDTLGMGLATSLSYYFSAGVLLLHFLRKNCILKFSFRNVPWRDSFEMFRRGLPMAICRIGNTVRSAFMNQLLAGMAMSTAAIAAYSVQRQVDNIYNPLTIGMAETVVLLTGILYGEEDKTMMKHVLQTAVKATLTLTLGVAVLTAIFSPWFASLYVSKETDPEAFAFAVSAVVAFAVGMPLYGLNKCYEQYIQGIGRNRMAIAVGFLEEAGILMLSAWVLSKFIGPHAAWYAFPVTQVVMLVIYGLGISVESRKMQICNEGLWNRVLLLPGGFDADIDACMEKSISSKEEVQELSEAVWEFCESRGCDKRTTYLVSLSVEEMAGNIIDHGFSKDKRNHSIDVRLLIKGEDIILRIRDDCLIFDPVKQLLLYSEEEPTHHMGLRMIIGSARDTQYTCILKLNNLIIKV